MHYHVLIVDDEVMLANMTAEYFNAFDVKTFSVASAKHCLEFLKENQVDLILLDINLEESNGFDLCKIIRKDYNTPIFFISARISTDDMMIALNIGGDDYITKPYELNVLLAKIKARLKRSEVKKETANIIIINKLKLDYTRMKAFLGNKDLNLKTKEFRLLAYLAKNINQIVSKENIINHVWDDPYISDEAISIQIFRLRQKIEKDPEKPEYIKTVWGEGYMLNGGSDLI